MLEITDRGLMLLDNIASLSESDIRLIGFIASEHTAMEKSEEGAEYVGYAKEQIRRLQTLGFIKEG